MGVMLENCDFSLDAIKKSQRVLPTAQAVCGLFVVAYLQLQLICITMNLASTHIEPFTALSIDTFIAMMKQFCKTALIEYDYVNTNRITKPESLLRFIGNPVIISQFIIIDIKNYTVIGK